MIRRLFVGLTLALLFCGCAFARSGDDTLDRPPKLIYAPTPAYPFELHKTGVTGDAVVELVVTSAGVVLDVHAVAATHPLFAKAAVEAMRHAKYEPGVKNGRRVNTRFRVPIHFDLK